MRLSEKMRDDVYVGALISNEYLKHHGIKGQKWGTKHGPPYPLDDAVSKRVSNMKKVSQKKVNSKDTATMAKYRTTNRLNRLARSVTNTTLGQKLAVRMNKGYREDRAKIKSEYKAAKKELSRDVSNYKEQQKYLKSAYKESKKEAATRAADAIYGKQSHELNKRIQSESVGKSFVKSFLMSGSSVAYTSARVNESSGRGKAFVTALFTAPNTGAGGSFTYTQTGVSKADRARISEYKKAQKEKKQ